LLFGEVVIGQLEGHPQFEAVESVGADGIGQYNAIPIIFIERGTRDGPESAVQMLLSFYQGQVHFLLYISPPSVVVVSNPYRTHSRFIYEGKDIG